MSDQQGYTDAPNTHKYRTFTRGTSFHVVTVDYADGDEHTFHVPTEVVNELDRGRSSLGFDPRLLEAAHEVLPEFMEGATVDVGVERWARLRALVHDALPSADQTPNYDDDEYNGRIPWR